MPETPITMPKAVSRSVWLDARKALLEQERRLMRERDALSAARRQLPNLWSRRRSIST